MIRALQRLVPYVLRVRTQVTTGLACIVVATALSLASPLVLKAVVDGLAGGVDRRRIAILAVSLVALAMAEGWFRYLMRTRLIGASRQIEYDLRNDFFAHLERLPLAYYQANRTGDLMSRATNDLGAVRMMVGPALMYFASTALGFVLAVGIMLWIDWRLTLIALVPLPGVTLATRYFGRAIHTRFEQIQAQLSDLGAVAQEAMAGVRVVRAYRQEPHELRRFEQSNDEYVARNRHLIRLQSAFHPSLGLCFGLSGLLVLWVGGRDVMAGRLTIGDFVAFSRYLVLLSWPLIAFGWVTNIVQRGAASWERMLHVLDAPAAAGTGPGVGVGAHAVPASRAVEKPVLGKIVARHLTFRYPGAPTNALDDISFTVAPGETLAIVGATGAGKSTLVLLLLRLHEPPRGALFLDDIDVRDWPLDALRGAMGVVLQEPFLFSDTVGGNVAFGLPPGLAEADRQARVAAAASRARLSGDVADFAHGYATLVGERGITLSGGQKQRAALARALATDPRVLILDDALSAVDTATEEAILRELADVRRSRTCVLVAHRISTVRDADQIVVLDHGRIVESGTHDALVARVGPYAAMHQRQLLEAEIEGGV